MAEPMVSNAPDRNYWPLTRQRGLRRRYGPDNPLTPLLEAGGLLVSDVFMFEDDFTLPYSAGAPWTRTAAGAGATAWASLDSPGGTWQALVGTADDNTEALFTTALEYFTSNRRPVAITRWGTNTAVAGSRREFGFAAAQATGGQGLVKATPTSNGTDYAVITRDTDHNTSVDLLTDGGTDAVQLVASSPGITFATQTWYDMMIAGNEQKEWRFYIDGVFQGRAVRGPDVTVTMGLYYCITNRADLDTGDARVDFVRAWQERVPFSGNAFTT